MKMPGLLNELELLAERLGMTVIKDRGSFKGGMCIVDGEETVVVNRNAPLEQRARALAGAVCRKDLGQLYIKPAVRTYLENFTESILIGHS